MSEIKANVVLTDIEGTTTSISFVKDILFPYAKVHSKAYLEDHWNEPATQALVQDLVNLSQYKEFLKLNEKNANREQSVANIAEFINYLIKNDLKLGPLKTLQGHVWAKGYAEGSIKGHVYNDVPSALQRWQQAGLKIAIYSSGSVKAQKLLFGNSNEGNLLPHIAAHFDTEIGHKQQADSYANIARELGLTCMSILFLTDIVQEAEAARSAGMQTVILRRPGNAPLSPEQLSSYVVVDNFDALTLLAN